jgi:hypothetical protein
MSVAWFAGAVAGGQIKWMLISGPGRAGGRDGRTGSATVMSAVQQVGAKTSMKRLYRVSGKAAALRAPADAPCELPAFIGAPVSGARGGRDS